MYLFEGGYNCMYFDQQRSLDLEEPDMHNTFTDCPRSYDTPTSPPKIRENSDSEAYLPENQNSLLRCRLLGCTSLVCLQLSFQPR